MDDYVKDYESHDLRGTVASLETRIEELEEKLKIATEALTKIAKADTQAWAIDALGMMKNDREGP